MKRLLYLGLLVLLTTQFVGCFGCTNDDFPTTPEEEVVDTVGAIMPIEYLELENSELQKVNYAGENLTVRSSDSINIYEGDIMIPNNFGGKVYELGEDPKGAALASGFWKDNIVYYDIDPNLPYQNRVTGAIAHWEEKTNVEFVRRTDQTGYVYFTKGYGCSSYIGYTGFKQNIVLGDGCSMGSTIHEIGHAIGMWHEQSRADRDNYLTVHWENILAGTEHNFRKYTETMWSGQDVTPALDFRSIMLYHPNSFSSNGKPTITKLDGSLYSINRYELSEGDIFTANKLYPEKEVVPTYVNGQWYTLYGVKVYRYGDKWYYLGKYGWREVVLRSGFWYYGRGTVPEEVIGSEYIDGEYYTIAGITVLRKDGKWYYDGRYGVREVVLRSGVWYYA